MPGEVIDTAFVEIVPLIGPGFQREVAAATAGAAGAGGGRRFSKAGEGAGKEFSHGFTKALLGITVAATVGEKAFEFLKESAQDAAQLQKAQEGVTLEFGRSSRAVLDFAREAKNIGINTKDSEQLSVRIGILAHNLGIGQEQAAAMAIDLQKLAGSIASIRGLDPDRVMANLPQVLAGNLRSLKQLGFAFSNTQIQQEAITRGAIRQGQALTPAAKAIGIYGLLTKQLGFFQQQAALHSDDLVNRQFKLRAAVDDAKESIGALAQGPMKEFTKEATLVVEGTAKMVDEFNRLGNIKIPGTGNSAFGFLKFAVEHTGPLGLVNNLKTGLKVVEGEAHRIIDVFTHPKDIQFNVRVNLPQDPAQRAVLGIGPLSTPKPVLGPPVPGPLGGGGFVPPGSQAARPKPPHLKAEVTPEVAAVQQRLQDAVALAQASGKGDEAEKRALRALAAFFKRLSENQKFSLAIRRAARVSEAETNAQIRAIDQQAVDDAKQAAKDRADAAKARADALVQSERDVLEANIQIAAATQNTVRDDIKAERAFIAFLKRRLAILKGTTAAGRQILAELKQAQSDLKTLQREDRERVIAARQDALEDALTLAEFTKGTGDDRRALTALEKFYAARVRASKKGSVARRKWMIELARTRKEIRDLDEETKKTSDAQRDAARQGAFEFLTSQQGFAANLASNLLGATAGLVGGVAAPPSAERTPLPKPSDVKIPLPAQTTVAAAATRATGGKPASSTQLETLIHLGRQQLTQLVAIRSTTTHVEALTSKELTRVRTATS